MPRGVVLFGKDVRKCLCAGMEGMPFEAERLLRCNRFKSYEFRLGCFLTLGLELAVDSDVGILVKTGVGLHARFRLCAAFVNPVIVFEKAHTPFEGFERMVVFEGVSLSLRLFDEFAVRDTGFGPMGRKMVGVEFKEPRTEARGTDDDAFFAGAPFFPRVHRTPQGFYSHAGMEVVHTPFVRRGRARK